MKPIAAEGGQEPIAASKRLGVAGFPATSQLAEERVNLRLSATGRSGPQFLDGEWLRKAEHDYSRFYCSVQRQILVDAIPQISYAGIRGRIFSHLEFVLSAFINNTVSATATALSVLSTAAPCDRADCVNEIEPGTTIH